MESLGQQCTSLFATRALANLINIILLLLLLCDCVGLFRLNRVKLLAVFLGWIGIDFQEDFLQCRHRNPIAEDIVLMHSIVKLLEEALELLSLLIADFKCDLLCNL